MGNSTHQVHAPTGGPSGMPVIRVGNHVLPGRALIAPMSGVSDRPFRDACSGQGAALVVSEMVASDELVREKPSVLRRDIR